MSGLSNVGSSNIYEAGDQRTSKASDRADDERYNMGQDNSHKQQDSKDSRTIGNKLAHETMRNDNDDKSLQQQQLEKDATLPARAQGHEPSKGAKIDQELREEEDEYLRSKGKK